MDNTYPGQTIRPRPQSAFRDWVDRLRALLATRSGEAELRAMDRRELADLGLDPGGIPYAAARGRDGR